MLKTTLFNILFESFPKGFNFRFFKSLPGTHKKLLYVQDILPEINYMGHGIARHVFRLDSRKVLKIAIRPDATKQNLAEIKIGTNPEYHNIIAKVYQFDQKGYWIISELVRPFQEGDPTEFESVSGIPFKIFVRLMQAYPAHDYNLSEEEVVNLFGKKEYSGVSPEQMLEVFNSEFIKNAFKLIKKTHVGVPDMLRPEHWGKTSDGRVVLLDYGFLV